MRFHEFLTKFKEAEEMKVKSVAGSEVTFDNGLKADLDDEDTGVEMDPATKKVSIKPKGQTTGSVDPKSLIKPGAKINIGEKVGDTWEKGDKFLPNATDSTDKKLTVVKVSGNKLYASDGKMYSKYKVTKP